MAYSSGMLIADGGICSIYKVSCLSSMDLEIFSGVLGYASNSLLYVYINRSLLYIYTFGVNRYVFPGGSFSFTLEGFFPS